MFLDILYWHRAQRMPLLLVFRLHYPKVAFGLLISQCTLICAPLIKCSHRAASLIYDYKCCSLNSNYMAQYSSHRQSEFMHGQSSKVKYISLQPQLSLQSLSIEKPLWSGCVTSLRASIFWESYRKFKHLTRCLNKFCGTASVVSTLIVSVELNFKSSW